MYYNNLNRKEEEEDLKFIPLNIKEPFAQKDSSWFPIVNMNSPNISSMTNNFILGFSPPSNGKKLDGSFLESIDYIPSISYTGENGLNTYDTNNAITNGYNQGSANGSGYISNSILSNNGMNNSEYGIENNQNNLNNLNNNNNNYNNNGNQNFELEYPSETISEELYSYNKEDKCSNNNLNNIGDNMNLNSLYNTGNINSIDNALENNSMENEIFGKINGNMNDEMFGITNQELNNTNDNINTTDFSYIDAEYLNNDNFIPMYMNSPNANMNSTNIGMTNGMTNNTNMNFTNMGPTSGMTNNTNLNPTNKPPTYEVPNSANMNSGFQNNFKLDPMDINYNINKNIDDYIRDYEKINESINSDKYSFEPPHMKILRDLDLGNDYESIYRESNNSDIDNIFKKIEEDYGSIMSTLKIYKIPYPIASLIIRKIISLTLKFSNKE